MLDHRGHPIAYRGVDIDITDQKQIQMALKQSEERLKTIISVSNLGAWEFNANTHIFWASPEYFTLLGYEREAFPETGQFPGPFKEAIDALIHPEDFQNAQEVLKNCLEANEDLPYDSYFRMKRADGRYAWIRSRGRRLMDDNGHLSHILVGTHLDVSDLKEVERKIKKISYQDKLTHLYNRRYYEEQNIFIDQEINLPISLIMIDANGLKLINDAFGHQAGDELLIKSSEALRNFFRKSDLIARVGGDEFVVLLPKTEEEVALELVKRIEKSLENTSVRGIPITLSFGVATKEEPSTLLEDIYRKAENNMYQSKIKSRDFHRQNSIQIIMDTLFSQMPKEKEHAEKISAIAEKIALALGLEDSMVEQIKAIGFYHDIGKIGIKEEVLTHIASLSEEEFKEFKRHTEVGYNILSSTNAYAAYATAILHHHEKYDGSGYPRGLKGNDIPFYSRILQVAHAIEKNSEIDTSTLDPEIWEKVKQIPF